MRSPPAALPLFTCQMSSLHGFPNPPIVVRRDLAVDPRPVGKDVLHNVIAEPGNLIRELMDCLGREKKGFDQ